MTLEDIKQAIEDGHTVCWKNHAYEVSKTMTNLPNCQCSLGRGSIYEHCDCTDSSCNLHHSIGPGWSVIKPRPVYNIVCNINDNLIGLTHIDGVTMNGDEEDFFIKEGK